MSNHERWRQVAELLAKSIEPGLSAIDVLRHGDAEHDEKIFDHREAYETLAYLHCFALEMAQAPEAELSLVMTSYWIRGIVKWEPTQPPGPPQFVV